MNNLANELRLRIDFVLDALEHAKKKKNWEEIRFIRDLFRSTNRLFTVLIADKMKLDYKIFPPKHVALYAQAISALEEADFSSFRMYNAVSDMTTTELSLMYRICVYLIPKINLVALPTEECYTCLKNLIDMQKREIVDVPK